jgi:hypothetical protein
MKPFIQDTERILNSANDLLKTGIYAENLVKVIENTPKDKVFTIGLFGGWGTGKSSIIKTAQNTIEKKHSDVKFITYDAWKYANDSFRRMFLLKIQQELKMRQTNDMSRFYQTEIADAEPRTKLSAKGIALAVLAVAIISIILFLIPSVKIEWKVAIPTVGTLGSFFLALLNGCFYDLKISYSKPALFAPEQFEACFKEMMSKCLKRKNWFQKTWDVIKDYVEVGESSIVGLEKMVIVVDNIDRCPSDMAYQLLTDIKTFLSNAEYNLVFIVPVDDDALKKHLFRRWNKQTGEEINKEKEEFLRKFFNVTLRIKPHQETELQHFAHEVNKENNLGYTSDTLAIVAKEFSDNPRRIIQLLNNLSGELTLYSEQFATENETAICAALILREEYPDFYKKATKNLDVVRKFTAEEAKDKDGKTNESLMAFMRVADAILKRTSLDSLQKVFTNTSSIFNDLPADIRQTVLSFDAPKVIEFANNNIEKRENIVDYALESLKTDVKYEATSQTTQWIDFLSQLCVAGIIDKPRFSAIDNALSSYYDAAIPAITKADALCYMGKLMNETGFANLRNAIAVYLNAEKASEDSNFESVLRSYYTVFTSDQDCKDIAVVVENYYIENAIDQDIAFTDTQFSVLFGNSFVGKQIENITATDDESHIENVIWCIENNKSLSGETFTALFSKFIELFGNTRAKSKESYLELISHLQPVINSIETSRLNSEPTQLYNLITRTRGIPHPSYRNQTQFDNQVSILDEVDEESAKTVTSFCYNIMRISGGNTNVSKAIMKLYEKCKDAVVEGALRIHSLGISLAPLSATLIKVDDYESANELSLLEVILSRQNDGTLMPDDDTVKNKIHSLVDNSGHGGVETLLKELVSDKQILDMVVEYVASLDSSTINSLPVTVSKFAVSTFKRENADTYKDNTDFLILVLKKGNSQQKKEVVRLMKDKINNERDLENVVLVLDNLVTEDQQMLKNLVGELEALKESETVSEDVKSRIAALIINLSAHIKKDSLLNKVLGKKS